MYTIEELENSGRILSAKQLADGSVILRIKGESKPYTFDPGQDAKDREEALQKSIKSSHITGLVRTIIGTEDIAPGLDDGKVADGFYRLDEAGTDIYVKRIKETVDGLEIITSDYVKNIGGKFYRVYQNDAMKEWADDKGLFVSDMKSITDPNADIYVFSANSINGSANLVSDFEREADGKTLKLDKAGNVIRLDKYTLQNGKTIELRLSYGKYYTRKAAEIENFILGKQTQIERIQVVWGGNRDLKKLKEFKLALEDGMVVDNDKCKVSHGGTVLQLRGKETGATYAADKVEGKALTYQAVQKVSGSKIYKYDDIKDGWKRNLPRVIEAMHRFDGLPAINPKDLIWAKITNYSPESKEITYSYQAFFKPGVKDLRNTPDLPVIKILKEGFVDVRSSYRDNFMGLRFDLDDTSKLLAPVSATLLASDDISSVTIDFYRNLAFIEQRDADDKYLSKRINLAIKNKKFFDNDEPNSWKRIIDGIVISGKSVKDADEIVGMQNGSLWAKFTEQSFEFNGIPSLGLHPGVLRVFEIPSKASVKYYINGALSDKITGQSSLTGINWQTGIINTTDHGMINSTEGVFTEKGTARQSNVSRNFSGYVVSQFVVENGKETTGALVYGFDKYGIGQESVTVVKVVKDNKEEWEAVRYSKIDNKKTGLSSMRDISDNVYKTRMFFYDVTEIHGVENINRDYTAMGKSLDAVRKASPRSSYIVGNNGEGKLLIRLSGQGSATEQQA